MKKQIPLNKVVHINIAKAVGTAAGLLIGAIATAYLIIKFNS